VYIEIGSCTPGLFCRLWSRGKWGVRGASASFLYSLENQGREEGAWYPFGIQAKFEQTCNFEYDTGGF
jgi:hypothetical protein